MQVKSDSDNLMSLCGDSGLNLMLVRHGQPDGNADRPGLFGNGLGVRGKQQAALLADRMADLPLKHVYTSDLARAYETAEAVCAHHPKVAFRTLQEIREISCFQLRGRPQARKADERKMLHEERARVHRFASDLRTTHRAGQLVVIIAHNGLNGMLLADLAGVNYRRCITLHCSYTGVTIANVSMEAPTVALRLMGCIRHLEPDLIAG